MSTTRTHVFNILQAIFGNELTIDTGYLCDSVILGPTIDILLSNEDELRQIREVIERHGFLHRDRHLSTALSVAIPLNREVLDFWQQGRQDRLAGSGVTSIYNSTALASLHNPQSFTFAIANEGAAHGKLKVMTVLAPEWAVLVETVLLYLASVLLLDPDQSRLLLSDLLRNGAQYQSWPWVCSNFEWTSPAGPRVDAALHRSSFLFPAPTLATMRQFQLDPTSLQRSPSQQVFVESEIARLDLYVTVAFPRSPQRSHPANLGRCWCPDLPEKPVNLCEAILLPRVFVKHSGAVLLAYLREPDAQDVGQALSATLHTGGFHFFTQPTKYSQLASRSSIIRLDGRLNVQVCDRVVAPMVRTAFHASRRSTAVAAAAPVLLQGNERRSNAEVKNCIIYVRSSTELQGDSGTSLERQLVQLLSRLDEVVDPMLIRTVTIAVEFCSSSVHPWKSRKLLQSMLQDGAGSFVLVSANPDRVTRRSFEVPEVVARLQQRDSEWWTLGAASNCTEWTCVNDPLVAEDVQRQLVVSRQVAVQHGVYTRINNRMTKLLATVQRGHGLMELADMTQVLGSICEQFECILVWTRTSPSFRSTDRGAVSGSLSRQGTFIKAMLRDVPEDKIVTRTLQSVSAYGSDAVEALEHAIQAQTGRVLVVSTSVERVVRHSEHMPKMQALVEKGHQFCSLLWDPTLFDSQHAIQQGQDWLQRHPQPAVDELAPPVVVPDFWFDHAAQRWSPNVLAHIKAAQGFCEGFRLTMFQGDISLPIPIELGQVESGARGFNPERARHWKEYAARSFGPDVVVNVSYVNSQAAASCLCRAGLPHSRECLCRCTLARSMPRSTPSSTGHKTDCNGIDFNGSRTGRGRVIVGAKAMPRRATGMQERSAEWRLWRLDVCRMLQGEPEATATIGDVCSGGVQQPACFKAQMVQ
ncbi:hypothetical protein BGZ99_000211 [Dissophora globulifera]|uniref:Uncharacterized protein n=1 Tax=Dissophora globulifera TaxID=979702 RepID=A0A9P6R1F0_9FUNG|nr:hypothetical protein BGZ99_000211 [Dissophora globulifera]